MKLQHLVWAIFSGLSLALVSLSITGCGRGAKDQQPPADAAQKGKDGGQAETDPEIKEALAQLSPEDRKLAQAQKYCVVQTEERLGSMGTPVKLTIQGETVFICCKSCTKKAQANPDRTLKTLENLKAKVKANAPAGQLRPDNLVVVAGEKQPRLSNCSSKPGVT